MESLLIKSNILNLKSLTLIDKLVLTDITRLCAMTGSCKKSDAHWSHDFGVGLATVSRSVKKLEELGLIVRESTKCQNGTDRLITLQTEELAAYLKKHRVAEYKAKKTTRVKTKSKPAPKAEEQLEITEELTPQPEDGTVILEGAGFVDYAMESKWSAMSLYCQITSSEGSSLTSAGGDSLVLDGVTVADVMGASEGGFVLRIYSQHIAESPEVTAVLGNDDVATDFGAEAPEEHCQLSDEALEQVVPDYDLIDYTPDEDLEEVQPSDLAVEADQLIDDEMDYWIEKWRTE